MNLEDSTRKTLEIAPDGSLVTRLRQGSQSSLIEFQLAPERVSKPIFHRTVEELWYVLEGSGVLWCKSTEGDEIIALYPSIDLLIPPETPFQFRSSSNRTLKILCMTSPPWPGDKEAVSTQGYWTDSNIGD